MKRSTARVAGAAISQPGVSPLGREPISTVAMPIVSSDATSVCVRPNRSPKWPKSTDPMGRAKNATPNTASDWSCATAGSSFAKKRAGNTSTAAVA